MSQRTVKGTQRTPGCGQGEATNLIVCEDNVNMCPCLKRGRKTFVKLETEFILDVEFFWKVVLVELGMYDVPER
jgi:hypothetical protein